MIDGVCVAWDDDEGWGVLRSADAESDVFAHFSELRIAGFARLAAGEAVRFEIEPYPHGQDGFFFRAANVTPREPAGDSAGRGL